MSTYERFIAGRQSPRREKSPPRAGGPSPGAVVMVPNKEFHSMSLLDNQEDQQHVLPENQQQIRQNEKVLSGTISSHAWNPYTSNVVALASTTSSNILICSVILTSSSSSTSAYSKRGVPQWTTPTWSTATLSPKKISGNKLLTNVAQKRYLYKRTLSLLLIHHFVFCPIQQKMDH